MWMVLVLVSLLVAVPQSSVPVDPMERMLGAWEGTLEHNGETVFKSVAYVGSSDAALVSSIDPATGRVVWRTDVAGSAWGQPAVTEALVYEGVAGVLNYMSPHAGSVIALDRTTGRPRWWYPATAPDPAPSALTPYGFAGSVAVDAAHVFAGSLDGRVYAFAR
jgi:putative pyrroloquinoline-quinone binding quinoprotein